MTALAVSLAVAFVAGGWLAAGSMPGTNKLRLADRLEPYLRPTAGVSATPSPADGSAVGHFLAQWGTLGRLLTPLVARAARLVGRLLGGTRSVRIRLAAAGSHQDVDEFRIEQVMWGAAGGLAGVLLTVTILAVTLSLNLLAALGLVVVGVATGVLGRDWWLSVQVRRRERAMLEEFPVVAELLALSVTAGESPSAALQRVCRLCRGELSRELEQALADARSGSSLIASLQAIAGRTSLDVLARFIDGMVIALERGTPLADVLRAQAADVREAGKRVLLASGGRREIAMMFPVVFLLLPVTVLFALYPGLVNITLIAR
ncbi:MAG TPA: type II secretion system F family protein [Mycobacteriales bacterium]|nr:type II secretion system F family protein [Mycobacteriales bacterium]